MGSVTFRLAGSFLRATAGAGFPRATLFLANLALGSFGFAGFFVANFFLACFLIFFGALILAAFFPVAFFAFGLETLDFFFAISTPLSLSN